MRTFLVAAMLLIPFNASAGLSAGQLARIGGASMQAQAQREAYAAQQAEQRRQQLCSNALTYRAILADAKADPALIARVDAAIIEGCF